ncbi:MAG: 2-methylisocitrate lyase-like PEP mutase family enzyme [Candidatus Azotimanducaceae bacterium]
MNLTEKLARCETLARVTNIPINTGIENGFAEEPEAVATHVLNIAKTGIAGYSIEEFSRDDQMTYDFDHAVERVQAAAEAAYSLDIPF